MQMYDVNPVEKDNNTYIFSYKYRLYPVEPNNFDFKVLLPLNGLTLTTNGGRMQVTLIAPLGTAVNPKMTKAQD